MIKSFLILNKAGVPLYTKTIEEVFDSTLVSCFLSAIQNFAEGMSQACIDKIDMEKMTFFYAFKGPIYSIIVAQTNDEIESRVYKVIAERLGRAFVNKYTVEVINKESHNPDHFSDFDKEYEEITSEHKDMLKMSQKDFVTEYFVNAATDENILGMVIYDLVNDKFLAKDIPDYISAKSFVSFSSMLFSFIDRLGKELKAGVINETLMRAEKSWIGGFRKGNLAVFMIFSHDFFGNILPDFVSKPLD
ncbi:MAG: hypothetical protein GF329_12740 [Candidatus Lokiarchaeota archaeon]|nr:hypothetical protein [Candidatus Lokiarchaeota archaeon]